MDFLEVRVDAELCPEKDVVSQANIIPRIRDKEGLLCLLTEEIDGEIISAAPRLKIIANCAVGTNNVDLQAARARGVLVTNTPGVLTETTAALTGPSPGRGSENPAGPRLHPARRFQGLEARPLPGGQDLMGKRLG